MMHSGTVNQRKDRIPSGMVTSRYRYSVLYLHIMHCGLVSRRKDTIKYYILLRSTGTVPSRHALWHDTQEEGYHEVLDTPVLYLHIMHCGLVSRRKDTIRYWILLHLHSFVSFAPC
jgi:hypothetical protein